MRIERGKNNIITPQEERPGMRALMVQTSLEESEAVDMFRKFARQELVHAITVHNSIGRYVRPDVQTLANERFDGGLIEFVRRRVSQNNFDYTEPLTGLVRYANRILWEANQEIVGSIVMDAVKANTDAERKTTLGAIRELADHAMVAYFNNSSAVCMR